MEKSLNTRMPLVEREDVPIDARSAYEHVVRVEVDEWRMSSRRWPTVLGPWRKSLR